MRPLHILAGLLATGLAAQAAVAQTDGTAGRLLGGRATLSQNIDHAAGLDSRRAIINGTAGALPPEASRNTGNTLPGRARIEASGRPLGSPLGTGVVSAVPTGGAPATVPATVPDSDPRRSAQ